MNKFYKIFLLILALIFLSTYNPNQFKPNVKKNNTFFKIQKIIISNNFLIKEDEILSKLDHIYGKNIFLIKRKDLEESVENINFLKKIEVKKKYPNIIIVKIFETKPLGVLFKDKKQYLLDSSSKLIEINKRNLYIELPNIIGEDSENNFVNFLAILETNKFPTTKIKNFYYFKIGRWDLELSDKRTIKFPYNISTDIIKNNIPL